MKVCEKWKKTKKKAYHSICDMRSVDLCPAPYVCCAVVCLCMCPTLSAEWAIWLRLEFLYNFCHPYRAAALHIRWLRNHAYVERLKMITLKIYSYPPDCACWVLTDQLDNHKWRQAYYTRSTSLLKNDFQKLHN